MSELKDKTDPAGPPPARTAREKLVFCVKDGGWAGLRTALWLMKIMLPISLAVSLLAWLGALNYLGKYLDPAMRLVGLPGETVVAFLTGALLNIYSGIAALGSLELTDRQVTILAMLMLVAHNFPIETVIQRKAGTPIWRTLVLRLAAGLIGAALLNLAMPADPGAARARVLVQAGDLGLWAFLAKWAVGIARLAGQVIGIVMALMILQRVLKEFGVIDRLSRLLAPVLWLMGLPRSTAFLWIVANTIGLAYGGAIIIEETQRGEITDRDAQIINRSVAVCHSLLEDTLLFAAIGAWAFWITVPRVLLAAGVVWFYRAAVALRGRRHSSV